ncbi:HlyC/CorC family transporter [Alcaligenes sp. WGS1538]|uniref:HlyC/CorC family transporter n=1 Tax=Alcaligenes sp. WGS1538 TaxID=3366811 RepID=UPI00372CF576
MSDSAPDPEPRASKPGSTNPISRLSAFFNRRAAPEDREDLKALLVSAHERQVIDDESLSMIAGTLDMASKTVADIMVPRSKIDMLDIAKPLAELLPVIIETGHSRFPIYENERDNIIGILLAKDLLLSIANPTIDLRPLIRPAVFIPETKRLNVLLHEFRSSRNHIAVVIDEHGGTAGLVTMEDVLEQIVGDIEDEYDEDAEQTIFQASPDSWRVMALTEIPDFNEAFHTSLPNDDFDTVGGWLASELGHIPRRGDVVQLDGISITVVRADAKRALWLHVQRAVPAEPDLEHN